MAPNEKPTGSIAMTIVCRPGERSAPAQWRSGSCAVRRFAISPGSSARNHVVPTTTAAADSTNAAAADTSHVSAAVVSGPTMKIASVITASSANALGMRLRSCARSVA
jgi:hypothetical protein